jgi:predicted phosphate transport protein (TIGR00153 family)
MSLRWEADNSPAFMTILTNLFGESPFGVLEEHGEKVHECVRLLHDAFVALRAGDLERMSTVVARIALLETEADQLRNHLHEMVTSRVLLPIRREEMLKILEHQDSIADRADEIGAILTYRDMRLPEGLMERVIAYLDKVLRNCELAAGIMSRLDLLVEASFKGRDALTVAKLAAELALRDDQIRPEQVALTRALLAVGAGIPPMEAMLWMRVVALLGDVSKEAERTSSGIRMSLDVKESK